MFGLPARYRQLTDIAKKHNLFLLQDAAQSFGGSIRNKKTCSFGDCASTSFFPAKPLGCYGDGGAIFTNNEELALLLKSIRVHGSGDDKYQNLRIGINGRMDTIQAANILEKLSIFDNELILRNQKAEYYSKNITSNFVKQYVPNGYTSSWAQYSMKAKTKEIKKKIMDSLMGLNVPTMIYYKTPLHMQKCFSYLGYSIGDFQVAEKLSDLIFSIPMHPYLNFDQQDRIIEAMNDF